MSFSFGTPASAPANTGLSGGFNFAAKPATPGFALSATTQPSTGLFGTPTTSAPAFGNTSFGASTAPKFGTTPALGATPAFGNTSGLGTAPAFGATSGLGTASTFGNTSGLGTAPAFGNTSGLGTAPAFGNTSGLGTAPAFGTTPMLGSTPAFGTTPGLGTAPAFGATSTAPTFGTGQPAFGATSTSAFGTSNISLGTGLSGGLNFGGSSLLGSNTGANLGTTSVTGTQPTSLVTPSLGLGGAAPANTGIGAAGATDVKTEPPKQMKLPNEISITVDSFQEFVKKQKALSSEVMRVSIKPLHKVSQEAESTLRSALSLCGDVSKARAYSRRLRSTAAAALAAAETAARDGVTPGLELESPAPPAYVKELVSELEQQILTFRRKMEIADRHMQSGKKLLTEQELTLGLRRMHDSMVALAGRLQVVHTQVEGQKEQYLNLRKYVLKDPTNVFENRTYNSSLDQILNDADSSKKKIRTANFNQPDANFGPSVFSHPGGVLGNIQQLAGPSPFSNYANTFSPYQTADSAGPSWQSAGQSFGQPTGQSFGQSTGQPFGQSFGQPFGQSFGQPAQAPQMPSFGQSAQESSFQLQKPPGKRGKQ